MINFTTKRALHVTSIRTRGPLAYPGWYLRDHKPGPFPQTDEERKAAAMKYGLRPEDYKPIPLDNDWGAGDYPDFGHFTYDWKDPYEAWTDPHFRRNWGEPVPINYMAIKPGRDYGTPLEYEESKMTSPPVMRGIALLIALFYGTYMYLRGLNHDSFHYKQPFLIKQYPFDFYRAYPFMDARDFPIKNYTFEPEDDQPAQLHETNKI